MEEALERESELQVKTDYDPSRLRGVRMTKRKGNSPGQGASRPLPLAGRSSASRLASARRRRPSTSSAEVASPA